MKHDRRDDAGAWQPTSAMLAVVEHAAALHGRTVQELLGNARAAPASRARQAAVWVLRTKWNLPWACVGRTVGNRDRTTAIYLFRQAEVWLARDPEYRASTEQLLAQATVLPRVPQPDAVPDPKPDRLARLPQKVKPKNRVPLDDPDAAMRFHGTNALVEAIAASGGGFR